MQQSWRERLNISRFSLRYPRLTVAFWIAIAVAGLLAFSSLKYALFPDISFPVVVINAAVPSDSPADTETRLTKPLENPLKDLPNARDVSSTTYAGRSVISLFFVIGTNLETATAGVKQAIAGVSLPPKATYEVIPVDLNESPTISYALTGESKSLDELTEIARNRLIPALQSVPGVLKVNLLGATSGTENTANAPSPTLVRFDGREAIALQVVKKGAANTLEVVSRVESAVGEISRDLPDIRLSIAESQAKYIRAATMATIEDLILAIVLSVLVMYPFLRNFKATLISALSIPLSLLGTAIVMAIYGFNLETLTLLALALVIGIVVDDAIVDVENISRLIDRGYRPREAAIEGTGEIGLAVTASTLTIVAVFIPVAFMGGAVGQFFKPFGLTVSAAVIFSLLVARTLSPVLAVYWLKPRANREEDRQPPAIARTYHRLLQWSLHHKKIVLGIALLAFVAGIALIPLISKGFIPKLDRGEFNVVYTSPLPKIEKIPANKPTPKSSADGFDWIADLARSPERLLLRRTIRDGRKLEAPILEDPDVASTFTIAGLRGEPNRGRIHVELKKERKSTTGEVQERIRRILPAIRGVTVSVEDIPFVQTEAEKPLQIAIRGDDPDRLLRGAETLRSEVAKVPGIKDVELSAKVTESGDLLAIERLDGRNAIYLSANLGDNLGLEDAAATVESIARRSLPPDLVLQRWGSASQSDDVINSFGRTLILATILMLAVLLLLFGSLLEPIVIALCIPLSIIGAMSGLWLTGSGFSIISLIGFIFLLGLLNKNAVLLMDYTNQLRRSGWGREEAILETGMVRLRPILMTTASTILGMLPIALGLGTGAELRQPMAMVIVGGLVTSSVLSLLVVPVLYVTLEDLWRKIRRKKSV
ncbi:efflux RND transporter permease subunit [Pannus brasiliensis CCIBt3594]|uniref:Efflux RND transporter permease subunit n=1 Tax=Pannus brasiliensis CCIBt3594 TaxID=1427578 RepID=A0AAW9QK24_9CHRO